MKLSRRDMMTRVAAVAAAAVLPAVPVIAVPALSEPIVPAPAVSPLWPIATQAQRQGCIVRTLIEHIADTKGKARSAVTTDGIVAFCCHYGMSRDEVVSAQEYCAEMEAKEARGPLN